MAVGTVIRDKWLYWGFSLTRYHLALAKARRIFYRIRVGTVILLAVNFWIWWVWGLYGQGALTFLARAMFAGQFVSFFSIFSEPLFLFGVLSFMYLFSLVVRHQKKTDEVEKHSYGETKVENSEAMLANFTRWQEVLKIPRRKRFDISNTFTEEAMAVLGEAYRLADLRNQPEVKPVHLFFALLSFNRVSNIFIRLGVAASSLQKAVEAGMGAPAPKRQKLAMPLISADLEQIIFQSYEEAYTTHQSFVSVTELLLATVRECPEIQELMYAVDIEKEKLENVVEWVRIRERLYRQYVEFRKAAGRRSTKGMDRAMTAVQTPYLNQFSEDLTMLAQFGHLDTCVARDREQEEIFRVVDAGRQNVLLVGEHGTGKRSVIEGLAQRMVADDVPARLKDKRLVRLGVSALLAGTTPAGAVERLLNIMREVSRAGNIILFIHDIHDLIGVSAGGEGGLDVATSLAEQLSKGSFFTFATTSTEDYARKISNSALNGVFTKVDIKEMDANQAIRVLESKVGGVEYKHNVFFSYDAIFKAVNLASHYLHDTCLPGSALEIMSEVATYTHNKRGANSLVSGEDVGTVIAEKTGIPATTVTADESTKLMNLENEMHKRVIGQSEAVDLVANALRRARAEIRSTTKPIANFLFMGPTGVGKTELAKTIATTYFGGEDKMVRLDMSEYQDKASLYRLLGAPGEKGSGILTEAVRRNPFALVLLDEIEKADKDVINVFLQVMDDGRLTDSTGHTVDFTNVILIATTNAGTQYVADQLRAGLSSEAIKERLLRGELAQYFRPEFLNRFDGIVLFKPLDRPAIREIAGLMLKRLAKDLDNKGIELRVDDAALDFLADVGFDPDFGARPMRRAIQERVENKLAEYILSGKLNRRDTVVVGGGGQVTVEIHS